MGVLEQVTKLKSQGMPDNEIIRLLREQNIPPKQIMDALDQSQIKNDVINENSKSPDMDGMRPSIMGGNSELQPPRPDNRNNFSPPSPDSSQEERENSEFPPYEEQYSPPAGYEPYPSPMQNQNQNYEQQNFSPQQQLPPQFPQPPQSQYSPDFYQPQEQQYYQQDNSSSFSTDTIIDVAEQVYEEKSSELKKQVQEISELKALAEVRINHVEKRLEKIESIIDKLQIAILEKIGSYGENIQSVKKEMSMMEDSLGKMINPLREIAERASEINNKTTTQTRKKHKKTSSGKK